MLSVEMIAISLIVIKRRDTCLIMACHVIF